MTDVAVVNKKGQITIPQEIRERLGIGEGSILGFKIKGNQIVIKAKRPGKKFVEEWCSIVENKLDKPLNLKKFKEEFYEQVEEDVLLRC
ncbi:MAG: AbrB/MazE/SpoVT family DNA-binding domain-containing protein [Candidatus Methanofastidiosia archaeon]